MSVWQTKLYETASPEGGLFAFRRLDGHTKRDRVRLHWQNCIEMGSAIANGKDTGALTGALEPMLASSSDDLEIDDYEIISTSSSGFKLLVRYTLFSSRQPRTATFAVMDDYEQVDESFGPVYWMVDHNVKPVAQQKLPADKVYACYNWWMRNGGFDHGNNICNYLPVQQLASLDRLFSSENEQKLEAFMNQKEWSRDVQAGGRTARYNNVPTSVTGGGVDLSGFRILEQ